MSRARLLLAEDDKALASLLEEYLLEADYEVVTFHRGDQALDAVRNEHFDLVLSDIVMPGADGLELLRYIHDHQADTLVVLMTGYSGIENALHAVERGAYDFASKPFQLPEIRVRLDNALRYLQLLRKVRRLDADQLTEPAFPPKQMVGRAYGQHEAGHH